MFSLDFHLRGYFPVRDSYAERSRRLDGFLWIQYGVTGWKGEISGSVCSSNKYKLSNKPGQIQVLLRILFVWCGGIRTRETPWRFCADMRKGPSPGYHCLLSTHFAYLHTSFFYFVAIYWKNKDDGKEHSWWAALHLSSILVSFFCGSRSFFTNKEIET